MALILRRKKDGSVHLDGPAPDYHEFSTRMLGRLKADGLGDVVVTIHSAEGDLLYEMERPIHANEEDESSPVTSYAFRRVGSKKGAKR
jgi:hypothetical protein